MGYMYEFPHSKVFDSDLREIVEMVKAVMNLPNAWEIYQESMDGKFEQLKNFVTNYFDNLNVQTEINNKIDAMIEDGTFYELLKSVFAYITPEMFGAIGDGVTDDTDAVISALNFANGRRPVIFDSKRYHFANGLNITTEDNTLIGTSKGTEKDGVLVGTVFTSGNSEYVVRVSEYNNTLKGISTDGCDSGFVVKIARGEYRTTYGITLEECFSFNTTHYGFCLSSSVNSILKKCVASNSEYGFVMPAESANSTMAQFSHCWARNVTISGYYFNYLYYGSLDNCACDVSGGYGYVLNNCRSISMTSCGAEYAGTVLKTTNCDGVSINGIFGAVCGTLDGVVQNASILENDGSNNVTVAGISGYQCTGNYAVYSNNNGVYILGNNHQNQPTNLKQSFDMARDFSIFKNVVIVPMTDPTQDYRTPSTHNSYIALITMFSEDGTLSNCYNTVLGSNELIIPHDNYRKGYCLLFPTA